MSKQMKIEDIKKVGDFYQALKEEVSNMFKGYEQCGIFDNWTEEQKKVCYGFGTHILSNVYNPIRNKYVKEERKKYDKVIANCNEFLDEYHKRVKDLQSKLDQAKERLNKKDEEFGRLSCDYKTLLSHYNVLKEKAIVPKFKIGQKVWYVYNKYQKFPFRCVIDKIVYDSSKNYKFRYDTSDELYIGIKEEDLFATEEEAQDKLKELQND